MTRKAPLVLVLAFLTFVALGQEQLVIIRPVEIHEVLTNPGMGITTFQRFAGQPLNEGLKWSEEGPTAEMKEAKVNFPPSSIAYCRWFWTAIEPAKGQIQWRILDGALEQARTHGQTLAIRLMPYDEEHPLPDWYQESGARRANKPEDQDGKTWQPDFSDPLYLKHWGDLIAAVGARYDGHPDLDTVDVSSIGYWGEGWSPYMPSFDCQKALIDIYFDAFRHTPLLMNFDQERALAYGTARGAGWRLDCWGDMRTASDQPYFPPEMLDVYPQQIVRARIQDAWTQAPVSLESCWVPGYWKQQGWDLKYILDQALRWHVTSVNVKSSGIPPEWKSEFDEFQKKMGYRYILRRLQYPASVRAGEMMPVNMWWFNAGVAPVYRDYSLVIRLQGETGEAALPTSADCRQWLPGDAVYADSLFVPPGLKPGVYRFQLAMVDPRTSKPAVRLAIEGRRPDGWYDLGTVTVR